MTRHAGKPMRAALRIMFWTMVLLLAMFAAGWLTIFLSRWILTITQHLVLIAGVLGGLWLAFAGFTLYFFRDPRPIPPEDPRAIVSPAQGKVDVIDVVDNNEFMGAPCQRISIFLSIFDVHVQRAPIHGRLVLQKYKPGRFMSATRTHSAEHNENVLLGFEAVDSPGKKVGLRLIAGLIARRIVTWIEEGETVGRSDRISLIQFGSRCDLYLPSEVKVEVQVGDRVKVGETVLATFN